MSSQHCAGHVSGQGLKRRCIKLLFHRAITRAPQHHEAGFIPSRFILHAYQGLKHTTRFCVFSCLLVIFRNRGCVYLLRPSAGNFSSLSCCCCRDLWPPACLQALLLFSYSCKLVIFISSLQVVQGSILCFITVGSHGGWTLSDTAFTPTPISFQTCLSTSWKSLSAGAKSWKENPFPLWVCRPACFSRYMSIPLPADETPGWPANVI